jgi:hypothetical protein
MKLTDSAIDMHVNHFDANDPVSGLPISDETPFISLSAGTVERDSVAKTNNVHRARRTALWFGILACEKWEYDRGALVVHQIWEYPNPRFSSPALLSNVRELI